MTTRKERTGLSRFLTLLPLYITFSIVTGTWLAFFCIISIKEVLLRRHDAWRFVVQAFVLNVLFLLTITSLIVAANRSPGIPDPTLGPGRAAEKRQHDEEDDWDDDIPLRTLRDARHRVRDRPQSPHRKPASVWIPAPGSGDDSGQAPDAMSTASSGYFPEVSPFPLTLSPFVPTSATEAGEDDGDEEAVQSTGHNQSERASLESERGAGDRLLSSDVAGPSASPLFAKSSSGGIRWCKKCDCWKPDRCHHCSQCRQCTLKMDHHCVWLGTCVGYNNYKPFLLFVSYGTLLAVYILIEGVLCTIQYFAHPRDYASPTADDLGVSEITPVSFMFLAIIGGFFTLTIGGLAGYHWYLACSNKTTLEDITHAFPSALIDTAQSATWRGDHLLSRAERIKLRSEATALNVYDLGWKRNLGSIFLPDRPLTVFTFFSCFWPIGRSQERQNISGGHHFEHDPTKLERLRELTVELRFANSLGVSPGRRGR